jgi:LysM repeat protein
MSHPGDLPPSAAGDNQAGDQSIHHMHHHAHHKLHGEWMKESHQSHETHHSTDAALELDKDSEYKIQRGDTLTSIARRVLLHDGKHDAKHPPTAKEIEAEIKAIAKENNIKNPNLIIAGDKLKIPGAEKPAVQAHHEAPPETSTPKPGARAGISEAAPPPQPAAMPPVAEVLPPVTLTPRPPEA